MPHFGPRGHDQVMCQVCARAVDTGVKKVEWRTDITGNPRAGNVCEDCIRSRTNLKGGLTHGHTGTSSTNRRTIVSS